MWILLLLSGKCELRNVENVEERYFLMYFREKSKIRRCGKTVEKKLIVLNVIN